MKYSECVRGISKTLDVVDPAVKTHGVPCYITAIRVSEKLEDTGTESRVVYAGGHSFSHVRAEKRMYYASAYCGEHRIIRGPNSSYARASFDLSWDSMVTLEPDRPTLEAVGKIEHSGLMPGRGEQFVHTMSLDEAKMVFDSFERANGLRSDGSDRGYCETIVDELDGLYVPLYTVTGKGLSKGALASITKVHRADRALGDATIEAIANTSIKPEITAERLTQTIMCYDPNQN